MIATAPQRNDGSSTAVAPRCDSRGPTSVLTLVPVSVPLLGKRYNTTDEFLDPADGIQLKIWQCYDNLPAQQWYYDENRIELDNQGYYRNSFSSKLDANDSPRLLCGSGKWHYDKWPQGADMDMFLHRK